MKTTNNKFETGATTHSVNDLILFADNTEKLYLIKMDIFKTYFNSEEYQKERFPLIDRLEGLLAASKITYKTTFPQPEDHAHIYGMNKIEDTEFCLIQTKDYENWKLDNQ